VSFSWHEKPFKFDFHNSVSRMFTYVQRWHDFWHERVIVNLKFLNKLKELIYTQKLAQRLFLFNSTFILLLRKKKPISQTYDSIFLFKCDTTFSKPDNRGLPVILYSQNTQCVPLIIWEWLSLIRNGLRYWNQNSTFKWSCLKVHTSEHEWPRMTTSDQE